MLWVTYRQHRLLIAVTALYVVAAAVPLIAVDLVPNPGVDPPWPSYLASQMQAVFSALVGVFWGAPLLAREFEDRTCAFAWTQDVTPARWLAAKCALLGGLILLGAYVIGRSDGYAGWWRGRPWEMFESNPLMQTVYAVSAFALGVLAGLLTRRVVVAMGATLAVFVTIRVVLATQFRDHYLTALRAPWSSPTMPTGWHLVNWGPGYIEYQPVERLLTFQLIEFSIFAVLAVAAFAVVFTVVRRGRR